MDSEMDAWYVALLPSQYGTEARLDLIERGLDAYIDGENFHTDQLIADIETFADLAFQEPDSQAVISDPLVSDPGVLSALATFSYLIVDSHEEYSEDTASYYDPDKRLLTLVEDLWNDHVISALRTHDRTAEFMQNLAEVVYGRKAEDDRGPPPGRVCTDVARIPDWDNEVYVELSLAHANREYAVRDDDGTLTTKLRDGKAYVPGHDLDTRLRDEAADSLTTIISTKRENMEQKGLANLVRREDTIYSFIDKLYEARQYDKLFTDDDYPTKLGIISSAIRDYDYDEIEFDEWLTAEEIYEAVDDYYPHKSKRSTWRGMDSPITISQILEDFEEHPDVEVDRSGRVNRYRIENAFRSVVDIEVSDVFDILELPCMANIQEHLQNRKPTRWVLFSVARILMSLENDFTIDDMVEFYRQFPWFDEDTTRYQLEYEQRRQMGGEPPLPVGCNNDNKKFDTFCIGKENCDYSIYQSLPMKDDVFDRLD
jgi:hypothetical protein